LAAWQLGAPARVVGLIPGEAQSMMPLFVLLGAILVGSIYGLWLNALVDTGLAAIATTLCLGAIGAFGIAMVLAVVQ
jgi:hypothetical protein